MKQILTAYGLSKETVTATIMIYMIRSPDGDSDLFNIVTGNLQEDTLAPHIFFNLPRLCTSNFDRSNKIKWLYTKNDKKRTISSRI